MSYDPAYNSKYVICKNIATDARCTRPRCPYNHALFDTSRLLSLVGSPPPLPASADENQEKTYLLVEYVRYSSATVVSDDPDAEAPTWRMRLQAGGRATLADSQGGSISVQPSYPVKGQGGTANAALHALESKVFGRSAPVDAARTALCKGFQEGSCRFVPCRFSHSLFDSLRVETLLQKAVTERGYADYRPIFEIEYIGRPKSTSPSTNGNIVAGGKTEYVWRVTLRCVVGYSQKSAPEPVVVTSLNLSTAMRLLEGVVCPSPSPASSKPQAKSAPGGAGTQASQKGRRRSKVTPPTPASVPAGQGGPIIVPPPPPAFNQTQSDTPQARPVPAAQPQRGPNTFDPFATPADPMAPPPSYVDATAGHYGFNQSSASQKRGF